MHDARPTAPSTSSPGDRPGRGRRQTAPAFRVLVVCTANHCRSPMIEQILDDRARAAGLGWAVGSAGTHVREPVPAHPYAVQTLEGMGITTEPGRSRPLQHWMISTADLILTAERSHRSVVATMVPSAVHRTFTLLQFAALAPHLSGGPGQPLFGAGLAEASRRARELVVPGLPELDDLGDPMGSPKREFRACAERIRTAVDSICAAAARAHSVGPYRP